MSTTNEPAPTSLDRFRLYRVDGLRDFTGYGETRTREFIRSGQLKAVMVDNVMRVPGWAIEEFISSLPLVETDQTPAVSTASSGGTTASTAVPPTPETPTAPLRGEEGHARPSRG